MLVGDFLGDFYRLRLCERVYTLCNGRSLEIGFVYGFVVRSDVRLYFGLSGCLAVALPGIYKQVAFLVVKTGVYNVVGIDLT